MIQRFRAPLPNTSSRGAIGVEKNCNLAGCTKSKNPLPNRSKMPERYQYAARCFIDVVCSSKNILAQFTESWNFIPKWLSRRWKQLSVAVPDNEKYIDGFQPFPWAIGWYRNIWLAGKTAQRRALLIPSVLFFSNGGNNNHFQTGYCDQIIDMLNVRTSCVRNYFRFLKEPHHQLLWNWELKILQGKSVMNSLA